MRNVQGAKITAQRSIRIMPKKRRRTSNASAFEIVSNHTARGSVFPFGHDTAVFTLSELESALKALKVSRRLVGP